MQNDRSAQLALVLAISKIPGAEFLSKVFDVLIAGLPRAMAAVAAWKISGLLAVYLIRWTLSHKFPATTANIVTGAFAGVIPGLLVFYALGPVTSAAGDAVEIGIEAALTFSSLLAGALAALATAGGAVVGLTGAEASAYLLAIVAPFISTNTVGMILAMLTALLLAFGLTLLANLAFLRAE